MGSFEESVEGIQDCEGAAGQGEDDRVCKENKDSAERARHKAVFVSRSGSVALFIDRNDSAAKFDQHRTDEGRKSNSHPYYGKQRIADHAKVLPCLQDYK